MKLRVLGVVAAVAASVFMAACGGGSKEPIVSTVAIEDRSPTKAEFIKQADAVCLAYNRKIERLNDELSEAKGAAESGGDTEAVSAIYREVLPIVEAGAEDLRALTPPPADAAIYSTYLRSVDQQIPLFERLVRAIDRGDVAEIEDLGTEIQTAAAASDGIAKGYGFRICGTE